MSRAQVWVAAGGWSGELDGTSARGSDGEGPPPASAFQEEEKKDAPSCRRVPHLGL